MLKWVNFNVKCFRKVGKDCTVKWADNRKDRPELRVRRVSVSVSVILKCARIARCQTTFSKTISGVLRLLKKYARWVLCCEHDTFFGTVIWVSVERNNVLHDFAVWKCYLVHFRKNLHSRVTVKRNVEKKCFKSVLGLRLSAFTVNANRISLQVSSRFSSYLYS